MDTRKLYWIFVILGAVGAIAGIVLRRSADPALQDKAAIVGWGGIALLLVARFFFKPKPVPKDVKELFPPKNPG